MRQIYAAEVKSSWITWAGVSLTFVAANYGLAIGFLYVATGLNGYADGILDVIGAGQFAAVGGVNVFFGAVVGAAVIGSSTGLVIASRRGAYARLALAGATPAQVVRVVMVQLVVVTLVCAVIGDLLAAAFFPFYVSNEVLDRGVGTPGTAYEPWAFLGANALCIVIALVGGSRQARTASRIPPVDALRPIRESTTAAKRRNWIIRGVFIVAGLAIIVGAFAGFPAVAAAAGPDAGDLSLQLAVLLLVVTGGLIVIAGPPAMAAFTHGWTSLIPSPGGVWHLARTAVRVRAERLTRSVTPVMYAVGLIFGMIGIADSLMASYRASGRELDLSSSGPWAMFSLIGAPLLIAVAGSVGSLIMMARQRDAELALASIVGATPRQRITISVFEALIITGNGLLLGLIMAGVAVGFMLYSCQLLLGAAALSVPWGLLFAIAGLSLATAVAATVGPSLPSLRKPAPAVIAKLVSE